jgi:hypothetical protein
MIVPVNKGDSTLSKKQPSLTANLNVHIEMVKADLPAGIIQLINMGQQATQGQSADNYLLIADQDRIDFINDPIQELTIKIKRKDEKPLDNEKIIKIEIKKNADFSADILAEPPRLLEGSLVGISTTTYIKTLCTRQGVVKISLKAKANLINNNGFIKISCNGADDLFIYYTNF